MQNEPKFGLRILCCRYVQVDAWNWEHLAAPYWRLYWNGRQTGVIRHDGRDIAMAPHSAYLIAPDTDYGSRSDGPIEQFYIHFVADRPFDAPAPGVLPLAHGPDLAALARDLMAESGDAFSARQLAARHALCMWALAQVPESWLAGRCSDPAIARAEEHMLANLHRPVANLEFAASTGLGLRTFLRRFRDAVGESCQDRFRRKRIQHACLLLQFTDHTLERIAADCGFCDRHHFSRVFRQLRGASPAAFRRIREELAAVGTTSGGRSGQEGMAAKAR